MKSFFLFLAVFFTSTSYAQQNFNIIDFGANGDGITLNTEPIQLAIDKCFQEGGGQVVIPPGIFLTGTINLKSNVYLFLQPGSTLKGSPDWENPEKEIYQNRALIYSENQKNIGIFGYGKIDGSGDHINFRSKDFYNGKPGRPNTVKFVNCHFVKLEDFTLIKGACWCIDIRECVNVLVNNINVISRVVGNNDGIDIVDSHNVIVSNSYFDCGDDAICPKSNTEVGVKNLTVTNCIMKSESNAIKFGTGSVGRFSDVTISNCVIYDTRLSGIALEVVDGAVMERISISNITMDSVNSAIFMVIGQRKGETPGIMRDVKISNIIATRIGLWEADTSHSYYKLPKGPPEIGAVIYGQPGFEIENVSLSNIYLQYAGGGTVEHADRDLQYPIAVYPEYMQLGITPAYGINIRHVKNISLENIKLEFIREDVRPAMFVQDTHDIELSRLKLQASAKARSFVRFKDVQYAFIHSNKPKALDIPFLYVEGATKDISIINNDMSKVRKAYQTESTVKSAEIMLK